MSAQEYRLTGIKGGREGDWKDPHNNYWCTASFEGIGEPVTVVTPNVSKWEIGMTYYGEVTKERSAKGKDYYRFRRRERPEVPKMVDDTNHGFKGRDDSAIQAQWAIRLATEIALAISPAKYNDTDTEAQAKRFMAMIERVKSAPQEAEAPLPPVPDDIEHLSDPWGYEGHSDEA